MTNSTKSLKWYWMPLTILLIGIVSISLLFSIHKVRVYQNENGILNNAILHVKVDAALFHLRVEEFTAGELAVDMKGAIASMDRAIDRLNAIITGGTIDSEMVSVKGTIEVLGLRKPLGELKSLLIAFKDLGMWRVKDIKERGENSISDRQFYEKFDEILAKASVIEEICKRNRDENLLKSRRIVLSIYIVWAFTILASAAGIWRVEMRRKLAEEALLESNRRLLSQTEELTAHRENLAGLVKLRTAELTTANEQLRFEIAERLQAEETLRKSHQQIRQLSSQLLMAQEIERKRISMELHDGLGQALNVMKLRIRLIEKGLDENREAAREDCESLLEYMDDIIEDVRRLSQDLSPAILEDLGLASALHWLVSNFRKSHSLKATVDIAEIDALFPVNHRITIYRVIQEALTNVGKHARAENVSLSIRRHEDKVTFSVEDNGKGFDTQEPAQREVTERGLGLTTMSERVRMMGGVFELWSRQGEGTRITFSLPLANGGA